MGTSGNYEIIVFGVAARAGAAVRARRHLGLRRRGACRALRRKVDWADAPRAAGARRAGRTARWCSTCSAVRKEFGGLVAVNDVSFQVARRRDPRPDRPERRRQVDHLQPRHRRAAGDARRGAPARRAHRRRCRRARSRGAASSRTFQHVKMIAGMTVLENVALGAHLRGRRGVPAAMLRARPRRGARACCARPSASCSASAWAS